MNELASRIAYLEQQSQTLLESMRYAGSLQRSILPNERIFRNIFSDAFVIFQPKDIVSGDFYWMDGRSSNLLIAAVDCTGHGVPGAFLTLLGTSFLNEITSSEIMEHYNLRTRQRRGDWSMKPLPTVLSMPTWITMVISTAMPRGEGRPPTSSSAAPAVGPTSGGWRSRSCGRSSPERSTP